MNFKELKSLLLQLDQDVGARGCTSVPLVTSLVNCALSYREPVQRSLQVSRVPNGISVIFTFD